MSFVRGSYSEHIHGFLNALPYTHTFECSHLPRNLSSHLFLLGVKRSILCLSNNLLLQVTEDF